jgi:hypothetical protein
MTVGYRTRAQVYLTQIFPPSSINTDTKKKEEGKTLRPKKCPKCLLAWLILIHSILELGHGEQTANSQGI